MKTRARYHYEMLEDRDHLEPRKEQIKLVSLVPDSRRRISGRPRRHKLTMNQLAEKTKKPVDALDAHAAFNAYLDAANKEFHAMQ